jgi:hypothetical protein
VLILVSKLVLVPHGMLRIHTPVGAVSRHLFHGDWAILRIGRLGNIQVSIRRVHVPLGRIVRRSRKGEQSAEPLANDDPEGKEGAEGLKHPRFDRVHCRVSCSYALSFGELLHHHAIQFNPLGDGRGESREDEREGNNEPGHDAQTSRAEPVQEEQSDRAKDNLAGRRDKRSIRKVKAEVDCQKDGIEERGGAESIKETHFHALLNIHIKMSQSDEEKVAFMLGCSEEEAHVYLQKAGGDVLKAIEDNLVVPHVAGEKYIPPPPTIDDGLTSEVREKLRTAREIVEQFNASFRNDLRGSQARTVSAVQEEAVEPPVVQQEGEQPPASFEVPELAVSSK